MRRLTPALFAKTLRPTTRRIVRFANGAMTDTTDGNASDRTGQKLTSIEDVSKVAVEAPQLSPADFRIFNSLATKMNAFHNHFRQEWKVMKSAYQSGKRPSGLSIRQFLAMGLNFCRTITMHHTIEEQHVFPMLAVRMPAFRRELELLEQHKQIHKGIDAMEKYLTDCREGDKDFQFRELQGIMEEFERVLWQHLDEEVEQLNGNIMAKYWTKEEIRRMPF